VRCREGTRTARDRLGVSEETDIVCLALFSFYPVLGLLTVYPPRTSRLYEYDTLQLIPRRLSSSSLCIGR
jgi:hypothetical protein